MANDRLREFTQLSKDLMAQAESDRDAQVRRLLAAGASPLMVDALMDVARKEMWAVLFSHLVEVAVQWQRSEDNSGDEDERNMRAYNNGKRSGIDDCIRNVFEYAQRGPIGSS